MAVDNDPNPTAFDEPGRERFSPTARRAWLGIHLAIGAAIVMVACSSGNDDTAVPVEATSTSVAATDTAIVADTEPIPSTSATGVPPTDAPTEPLGVSFANDVQPILENNCASCHTADGPGTVHLPMETAGDVDGRESESIDAMVGFGFMPPWPAGDGGVTFHDDRRLDASDIETIAAWAEEGGIIDVAPETPIQPTRQTRTVIERDVELQALPYKGSVADKDDYRCQIYDPELTDPAWLQGYGIEADRTEVVHHALVFKASASARESADTADSADPDVGWSCTGLSGVTGVNQILSWAPGQDPTLLPADTGILMGSGDFFVMQIHYHYEEESADLDPDETMLVADFADEAALEAAGGALDPIELTLYIGPAEIPCSKQESGPLCDRDAVIADLSTRSGSLAGGVANALLFQCGATVEDFAEMTDGIATSSCDLPAQPGQIVSIWGHEHEIGKAFKMTLNPDTPDELVLLDIPNWNFDWQLDYRPVDDIVLEPGDVIRVECTWDRARIDEDAEPRYVIWAEGTNDEMCYSQIVTRPA